MLFVGHVLLGLVVYLIFSPFFSAGNELIFFLVLMLGSLLPDIDEEHSKINQWSGIVGKVVAKIFPHRGFLHSLLFFGILAGLISYFWQSAYAVALLLGYLAHIIGDGISLSGVRVFFPFRVKIRGPLRVGSHAEMAITLLLFILVLKLLFF